MASLQTTTILGNPVWTTGNYNRVINRGNPGSGSPLLLSDFGTVHYYYATNTASLVVSTQLVENAVYELHYMTYSTGANQDPRLIPNYTTYGGQFSNYYWGSPGSPTVFDQNSPDFYFDHYGGGEGVNPCGTFTLFTHRAKKQCMYYGGDSASVCVGTGRWNNSTTQWLHAGTFQGIATAAELKIFIRRIG
jgi:hypothetical protein